MCIRDRNDTTLGGMRVLSKNRLKIIYLIVILSITGGIAFGQGIGQFAPNAQQQNAQLNPLANDGSINKQFAPPIGNANSPLEMRILIVTAIEDDGNMVAMRYLLEQYGVPYDIFVASRQELTLNTLVNAKGHGRYQGIVLSTHNLGAVSYTHLTLPTIYSV